MRNYTINELANALTEKGYNATVGAKQKNGIDVPCIDIAFDGYGCVLYPTDDINAINNGLVEVDKVVEQYVELINKSEKPTMSVTNLTDLDYVKKNIMLAIEKDFGADYLKRPTIYNGISKYMIINVELPGGSGSVKVTDGLVKNLNADEKELWEIAMANTIKASTIEKLCDYVERMTSMPTPDLPIWIVTNNTLYKGASAILNTALLDVLCTEIGTDELIIIPSSIHECLVLPKENEDLAVVASMIREVNETEVSPTDVLSDEPLTYKKAS